MTRERRRPRAAGGRAGGAAWWEAAFAAVSAGIAVLDAATGEVLQVNEAFAAMVGRDAAGIVGTDLRLLLALDDVGAFTDTLEAARRGDTDRPEVVLCWPRADGSVVSLRVSAAAVRLGDGPARELLLHAHDATDEVRAKRAVVASRDLLAEAERLAHLGSFEWDSPPTGCRGPTS